MRIAVIGCGGVGGVIAAGLTRAGADVTPVVGSAQTAEALAKHGFRVREVDGAEWSVPVAQAPVLTPDREIDLAIVATQATAMARALTTAAPFLARNAVVVTCQNGLPEERAAALLGERVVGCVVGWGASMVAPGVYARTSRGGLELGR